MCHASTFHSYTCSSLPGQPKVCQLDLASVVHQDVGALDVTVQKVPLVAIGQTLPRGEFTHHFQFTLLSSKSVMENMNNLHYLPHDGGVEPLSELYQSGIEKTLQNENINHGFEF